jgi:folate-binding Fe-S cluster repair protein YgfZ
MRGALSGSDTNKWLSKVNLDRINQLELDEHKECHSINRSGRLDDFATLFPVPQSESNQIK